MMRGTDPRQFFSKALATIRSPVFWLIAGVLALEFFLFDQFGARRHTPVYPRWHDQIEYLSDSYRGYEFARSRGVVAGLLNALTNPSGQGALHDFFALVVFLFTGPSRSAALSVNMLALIAWQVAVFLAAARLYRSPPLAVAVAMLPLALSGPWQNIPGSAYDFRLDHLAMCALGIAAATGVFAGGFRSRRGSNWFGAAAGLAVATRFLTGPCFVLIFAGFAGSIIIGTDRRARLKNLLRAALMATVIAGPFLWINYESVRDYYSIDRYFGPESAIRNPRMGIGQSLRFVVEHLGQRHLGGFFGGLAITAALLLACVRKSAARATDHRTWLVGALFVLSPLVIFTLHPQKSEVVVGALAPGVVTLAIAAWAFASRRVSTNAMWTFAALVIGVTLVYFTRTQVRPAYSPATLADIRLVNTMVDRVFLRARAADLQSPRVAVDHITESFDAPALRVIVYERKRAWVPFAMTLPTGTGEPSDALVMERLGQSDFVFLTEDAPVGPHPFDRKLAELRPRLRDWCEANLRAADRFTLFGRRMVLYQRPEIPFP